MSSVDDRIVNMQFNNKQFTQGVTESQRSLDGLERALANTAKSKGLDGMAKSVDNVASRFTAMRVAGIAAIATVASKATAAGLEMVKGLTIDPILDGFREYQTGLDSIQTIMANTGKNVKVVNAALDQLNEYSDQTIYNFGQMAKNVGTFTAAGVDLKTSTASIKGIANLAALSGSNSEQASSAMYQLSQAIASGKVGLQDWNSVVNAGMGGKVFQTALARTAEQMGTLADGAVKTVGPMNKLQVAGASFRDSIASKPGEQPWLTSDVLVETLKQISGSYTEAELRAKGFNKQQAKAIIDMQKRAFDAATQIKTLPQLLGVIKESIGSSFAGIFRTVMGDFKQSKKLWTSVGNVIIGPQGFLTKAQNGLQGFVTRWAELGGRARAIDALKTVFSSLGKILGVVGKAFRDVFPPQKNREAGYLFVITKAFQSFVHALTPSESTLKSLRSIFGGVFAVLHVGVTIVNAIRIAFTEFIKGVFSGSGEATGGILSMVGSVGEVLKAFDRWITAGGILTKTFRTIGTVAGATVGPLLTGIGLIIKAIAALVSGQGIDAFMASFDQARDSFSGFISLVSGGRANLAATFESLSGVFDRLQVKLDKASPALGRMLEHFREFSKVAGDMFAQGVDIASNILDGLVQGFEGSRLQQIVESLATDIPEWIKGVLGIHSPAQELIPVGLNIAQGIGEGILSGIGFVFSALGKVVEAIFNGFGELFSGMDALDFASVLNALFAGALILTIRNFVSSFAGIGTAVQETFGQLTDTLKTMQQSVQAKIIRNIAIAVGILVVSLIALSLIPAEKIGYSLGAIAAMMGMLVGSMATLSKVSGGGKLSLISAAMVGMSAAIVALTLAVTMLGQQDPKKVFTGIGAMLAMMTIMVGAVFAFSKIGPMVKGAAGSILIMSAAMVVLSAAILALGSMDVKTLAKGLGAMAVALALFSLTLLEFSKTSVGAEKAAGAIFIMSAAMVVLAAAVGTFGNMDMGTLVKGFTAMAIGLGLMVAALMILSANVAGVLVVAQAMALLSVALIGLAIAVGMFGNMDMSTLAIGFGAIAVGLGLLLLAAAAAIPLAPGLAILSSTFFALGAALALAGAGMFLFGAGFALMAAAGVAGVAILVAGFEAFMMLLPTFAIQVAAAFVTFLETIAKAAPRIRAAFSKIFQQMVGVITDAIPTMGTILQTLITTGINIIKESVPQWIEMGFTIIDEFLNSAEDHVPDIAESALNLIANFLDTIGNNIGRVINEGAELIVKFIQGLADAIDKNAADLRAAGLDLATSIIDGMTGGLLSRGLEAVRNAAEELADALPGWMKKVLGINSPSKVTEEIGRFTAMGFARGIMSGIKMAVDAATRMANAVIAAGDKTVLKAQQLAAAAQRKADKAQAKADATRQAAARLRKSDPKEANRLKALADRQQQAADAAQARADRTAQNVSDVETFQNASLHEKGDIKDAQAVELADRAQAMLAKANAEAAQARKIMETNRKAGRAMLAQARKDAKAAKKLAEQAQAAHKSANKYYQLEVEDRIKQLEEDRAADEAARKAQEEYDAADAVGKAEILRKRAEANQLKAEEAQKKAEDLIAEAKTLAATDAVKAMEKLDQAEEAAKIAEEAAAQAKQERQQAEQVLSQGGSGGPGGSSIQPSRSVLEDAASAVDRYTSSLQMASDLAASQQSVTQFVQNNYSPVALNASEVYRQSKNLLSAAEVKMGATP